MTAQLNPRGDVAVLVPAAGLGVRLGPGGPKALRTLAGESLLVHAVRRLAAAPSVASIAVAAPPDETAAVAALLAPVAAATVVAGGATRQESVAAALAMFAETGPPIVLVHDAARALTPIDLIERVAAAVRSGHDAVVPVLPIADTVRTVDPDGHAVGTVDRSVLRAVQTPQGFRREVLVAAHAGPLGPATDAMTDDAGLVERLGVRVTCVEGSEYAMKVTRPIDMIIAEALARHAGARG